MTAQTLYFTGPRTVEIRCRDVCDPGPDELRVRTIASAISAGTERLIYSGDAPAELPADEQLEAFDGDLSFPLSYGYAAVGEVTAVGSNVDDDWLGQQVFAYNPHESHFLARPDDVLPVPDGVSAHEATLFANLETAVTFLLDGEPLLGERVAVLGQGVVGLLTTALLSQTPLESLVTFDTYERRRERSTAFGADRSLDPDRELPDAFVDTAGDRADLTYELSGNPDALDDAISTTGFDGRVIVGSWYGTRPASVELGGRFHRDRLEVRSSQVSTIDPRLSGRWSRERRHELTWEWLQRLEVTSLLTHERPLSEAPEAYELLEKRPEATIQLLFTYE
ncbi:zinc-dependent alcohol dehydrogenase [Natronobacterium gregoryi]|uniref:Oxidoreductase n=2 Tax=Natronobacterium gregoryi TaxID=44930 RepID=L0AEC9_NATGS|nr:zinc-binding alcohol dehydrogenase [Natronobacterium gregoryi]AFZ71497.1 theronine dehydrogenase-like Zn-dependent dehydrogenase [Natronobacterium gregoryi SP2]PLK18702.1 oxidoreductase [Natronobacterium gregoryi SP2]SFJ68018.1 2-desacetyl-2-hydroxyethyl bacteriochlorophyllide A dehydrogenase [Natronobacterium gregoryi]